MQSVLALLALSLLAIAAPLSNSEVGKRMPDVDQQITDDGHIAAATNSVWQDVDEGDLPALAAMGF
ncbi:hypothetical protein F5Y05DRAFT_96741 [Hypoxylon sp. FL0543]|nr:hypothetical protein F5Y05DRAFT_96741 [Hypoxylon sp. FL0543]